MSIEYDNYLKQHRENVAKAAEWIRDNLQQDVKLDLDFYQQIMYMHDYSKDSNEEYYAYDDYFYGELRTKEVKEEFNNAWLHHIHNNKHHWQYWVLINDDKELGATPLRIPYRYVIEMICDWWSFSWKTGNLYEIFDWYENHKKRMILSKNTRELVEQILGQIKEKLDEQKDILGGLNNGQDYWQLYSLLGF